MSQIISHRLSLFFTIKGICTWKIFDTFESDLELEFGGELCWVVQHAHVENVNLGHSHSGILALPETLHLSLKKK